jgi:hypothetical protein
MWATSLTTTHNNHMWSTTIQGHTCQAPWDASNASPTRLQRSPTTHMWAMPLQQPTIISCGALHFKGTHVNLHEMFPMHLLQASKGGQQHICGPMPLQKPTIITCGALHFKGTHVKLHKMFPMHLLQASKGSINSHKSCNPLGPLPLHEHHRNPSLLKPTPSLHT